MRTRVTLVVSLLTLGACAVPACAQIGFPGGNAPFLTTFGDGVQIYKSGSNGLGGFQWNFFAPSANLFSDSTETLLVGTHFVGPSWQYAADGSTVVGAKIGQLASPNPNSIPQLLLVAKSHSGSGLFDNVSYIQRLNTFDGLAPSMVPTALNQEADVHYTQPTCSPKRHQNLVRWHCCQGPALPCSVLRCDVGAGRPSCPSDNVWHHVCRTSRTSAS